MTAFTMCAFASHRWFTSTGLIILDPFVHLQIYIRAPSSMHSTDPLHLTFTYPIDYPSKSPPVLSAPWLPRGMLAELAAELQQQWKDAQGTAVVGIP